GVDGNVGRSQQLAGVIDDRPLDAVVGKNRDPIPPADADRGQRPGAGPDTAAEFRAGDRAPGAAGLLDEAVGPRDLVDPQEEELRQGARGGRFGSHSPVYHERVARRKGWLYHEVVKRVPLLLILPALAGCIFGSGKS